MQFNVDKYREDVLNERRGARGALGDLLTRYAITLPATDAEIAERVSAVRAYWRSISGGEAGFAQAQIARAFLAADERLQAEYGAQMGTAAWWQARQQLNMPVSIYLSDETIREQVETAVDRWLITADVSIDTRADPVVGSWFRRMQASAKRVITSPAAREALLTAAHVADSHLVQTQDAYITATLLQNVGPVLQALQPTKDAVVRAGALLIVKLDWVVQVHQLTAAQQAMLDHRSQLAASPKEIISALQLTGPVLQDDAFPPAES